ncbi:hypothetical protein ACL02U_22885 [Streptomyces sp. MS06]|uniref:hypothetical protein n=1 Tax=Streptomyces sp. MS06 TaxID=3385974 RepID=UPI0039A21F62
MSGPTAARAGARDVPLWEVCIPTLRLDAGRAVRGCQIRVLPAGRPVEAERMALDRAMAPGTLQHRRNAELEVRHLLVYAWRKGC